MSRKLKEKADALLAAERGTVYKPQGAEVEIALAYPNTYHVGMSNLGMHQIYSILNNRSDTACERVFLPDEDDAEEYRETGAKLFTLESKRPVKEFDILAFSVSFERDYLNILEMLRLSGIAADKRERTKDDPLVILGGICSFFNPEPLADFFDLVIVGEGEEVVGEFVDAYKANRSKGRYELLRSLCAIPGAYVPEFYEVIYNEDGTIKNRNTLEPAAPDRIVKRTVVNIGKTPAASIIITPNTEFSDMYLSEITRGCGRHCRFCMAGYIYLPPRNLSLDTAKGLAARANELSCKIGLVGAALSDYPDINDLCAAIEGRVSVSSLRADSVDEALIERLARSGHKTISIAPEAGLGRLRRVINKGIKEKDVLRAAELVFGSGILNLKLYFMIGLPTETWKDVDAIILLAEKVREIQLKHAKRTGRIGRITLSVNSFVPKPFTPFQWEAMEHVENLNKKLRSLEKAVNKIGNMNIIHDLPKWEYVQALLSRGDRRTGRLIRAAHENGGNWWEAAKAVYMDRNFNVCRRRAFDEVLPWDFIDIGVRKEYLIKEYERALKGLFTPPCRVEACKGCGVCEDASSDHQAPGAKSQTTWNFNDMTGIHYLTIPALEKINRVLHAFTTRQNELGGRNNGIKSPEDWNEVAESFGIAPERVVTVNQVHGENIVKVDKRNFRSMRFARADAMITDVPGIAVGVETADCVPILLYDPDAPAVAAVHAGWRSTVKKIAQKVVRRMKDEFGANPSRMIAAIGPAIGPECYEVDEPVMGKVRESFTFWKDVAAPRGNERWNLDLVKANRIELMQTGLFEKNIHSVGLCTSCRKDLFYSFRAEGRTGRMLSVIMITP